jgi:uncharacterized protein YbjT (DUF2867 family)
MTVADKPTPAPAPLALVFGASGYVGSNLVPRLLAEGLRVRAASRNRKVLEARAWAGVECMESDALAPATLPAVLAGVDTAYYLVHSMAAGHDFGRLDLEAADHFAAAAAAAGVRRIVYLGGLIPPDAESEHLLSRRDTGVRLRAGAVPVTEIRAGIIIGPGSAAYEVIRDLVNHLPVMLTPRWVRSRSAPIALSNLLEYLVRVAELPEAAGRIYDAGGPETVSYEDLMRIYGAVVGRKPRIIPVPVLTPQLSAYWLGLVTAVPASIGRALIGGLAHDILAEDAELRALVPQPLHGVRAAIEIAIAAEQAHTVAARWTEGLLQFRGFRLDNAWYAKRAGHVRAAAVPIETVWDRVRTIGGSRGYYALGWLWWLRAAIDWLVGGAGLTHGRRHPVELRVGDRIDYWTVLGIEEGRRLTLHFGLRAPGSGVLEFEVHPLADGRTELAITAYWHPQGVWGLLYWYAMVPAHGVLFARMTRNMLAATRSDDIEAALPAPPAHRD